MLRCNVGQNLTYMSVHQCPVDGVDREIHIRAMSYFAPWLKRIPQPALL